MTGQVGRELIFAEIGTNLIMAPQTEITVRAVRKLVDFVAERKIHGAELGIRMLGCRPLPEVLGMARPAR